MFDLFVCLVVSTRWCAAGKLSIWKQTPHGACCFFVNACRLQWRLLSSMLAVFVFVCMYCPHGALRCRQTVDLKAYDYTVRYPYMLLFVVACRLLCRLHSSCWIFNARSIHKLRRLSANLASSRGKCDQKQARFRRVGMVIIGEIKRVRPLFVPGNFFLKLEHFFLCVWKLA